MRNDDALMREVHVVLTKHVDDLFMRKAMEAISADSLVLPRVRQGCQSRQPRQAMMERRVKTGDLGEVGIEFAHGGDAGDVVGQMQRREGH